MRAFACVFAAAVLSPLAAAAQAKLSWQSPAECPSAATGAAELTRLLREPLEQASTELTANVRIKRVSRQLLRADIVIRNGDSEHTRVLRDPNCNVLTHAAAVVVALSVHPEREASLGARTPSAAHATGALNADGDSRAAAVDAEARRTAPSRTATPANAGTPASSGTRADANAPPTEPRATKPATDTTPRSPSPSATASDTSPRSATPIAAEPASNKPREAPQDTAGLPPPSAAEKREPPAPTVSTSTQSPSEDSSPDAPATDRRVRPTLGLSGRLDSGVLPRPSPGLGVSLRLLGPAWLAGVCLSYLPAQQSTLSEPAGAGGQVALFAASIEAGPRFRFGWFDVPVVAGVELGMFEARGNAQLSDPRVRTPQWAAAYAGTGLRVPVGRAFALSARLDAVVALARPSFAAENAEITTDIRVFHRPDQVVARALLELDAHLP